MPSKTLDELYILARDTAESKRLNKQHEFFTEIAQDTLLDDLINPENILAVADIGTGTGVWLQDTAAMLRKQYPTTEPRVYHGFDISNDQFPLSTDDEFEFSVQDVLNPFPATEHGRYDLVHVRLLLTALRGEDYPVVISNLKALLKPGGYIQWEEHDNSTWAIVPETSPPVVTEISRILVSGMIPYGVSPRAPHKVFEEISKTDFSNVGITYYEAAAQPEKLYTKAAEWHGLLMMGLLPPSLTRIVEASSKQDAVVKAKSLVQ